MAPEDHTAEIDFQSEKTRSKMQKGKILLEWKTEEKAPDGEVRIEYSEAIKQVEQDYSEAILQQRVPPGLHGPIKRYFDTYLETLEKDRPKTK